MSKVQSASGNLCKESPSGSSWCLKAAGGEKSGDNCIHANEEGHALCPTKPITLH